MYYQTLYTPGLLSYVRRNHIKVILLIRENVFRNAISDLRARSTGIYHHQEDGESSNALSKLLVDTNALQGKMQHIIDQNKKLEDIAASMDHLKIRYEDFSVGIVPSPVLQIFSVFPISNFRREQRN